MPWVLLCYYGVALPTGCALGFSAGWGARGMVAGMLGGKLLHAAAFAVLVATTDWEAERRRAARSVADGAEGATTVSRDREAAAGMVAAPGGEGEGGAACELADLAGASHGGAGAGAGAGADTGADTGAGLVAGLVAGRPGARRTRATDKVQLLAECSSRNSCSGEAGGRGGAGVDVV